VTSWLIPEHAIDVHRYVRESRKHTLGLGITLPVRFATLTDASKAM